ncbi:MAG: hypothetical protein H0U52_17405 [Chloroflexi bacterium]|nr:hypothetical protein [Chloroflexota bacterium]
MSEATEFGPGQTAILVTAIAGLVTTLATLVYNFVREGRRHRWEVEADERHRKTAMVAEADRAEIATRVEEAERALNAKLDENTEISKQAFTEANHINEKIRLQGEAFDRMLQTALNARGGALTEKGVAELKIAITADDAKRDKLQDTADDTQQKVTDIHQKLVDDGG